jgi:demethylmenaquinone methyltransferase/2-methoxy-6-polyprenyl-1,4-benzoquinol methylase
MSLGTPRLGSGAMFDRIADRYDHLNRVLSLGMDHGWRRAAVRALALPPGAEVLDLATGTADLAIRIATSVPGTRVVGVDPSAGMLMVGRRKIAACGLAGHVTLVTGDAEALPFADGRFAGTAIAFGIRNVPDRLGGLREMGRVTRPGGRIVVLELAEPRDGLFGRTARFYVRSVVPRVGGWLSGAREYRYLQESIATFPPAEEFAALMRASGLRVLEIVPLGFGACTLFVAEALAAGATIEGRA